MLLTSLQFFFELHANFVQSDLSDCCCWLYCEQTLESVGQQYFSCSVHPAHDEDTLLVTDLKGFQFSNEVFNFAVRYWKILISSQGLVSSGYVRRACVMCYVRKSCVTWRAGGHKSLGSRPSESYSYWRLVSIYVWCISTMDVSCFDIELNVWKITFHFIPSCVDYEI